MKKLIAVFAVTALILSGVVAYAHGPGRWGGNMMSPGYGGHMMDPGYGGHMMGKRDFQYGYDQKFLDETAELRKDLHNKRFEYFEMLRNQETSPEAGARLEKEINELQAKLYEKAPRTVYGMHGGYGCR
jgi:hypothetical protein